MAQSSSSSAPPPPQGLAPKPGDTTVSSEWLEFILRKKGLLTDENLHVVSVEMNELSDNRGLAAIMHRLSVVYSNQSSLPKTFMLKTSPNSEDAKAQSNARGQYREGLFYDSDLLNQLEFVSKNVLYGYGCEETGEYVLLMKDLKTSDQVIGVNFVFGNQVWGMPEMKVTLPDPVSVLEQMYLTCARLNAKFWKDSNLWSQDHGFLKASGFYKGENRDVWEQGMTNGRNAWNVAKERNAQSEYFKFSEKLVGIIDRSYELASWENMQKAIHEEPFALCHGDFHASNMFVNVETLELSLFDWSEVGIWNPVTDLAQTLISDVNPDIVAKHSKRLLRVYYDELIRCGADLTDFSFEDCWNCFCKNGPERWIWLFSVLASLSFIPEKAVKYWHDHLLSFIESHGDYPFYNLKSIC
ncbi:hypothetical protein FDP41_002672 [Naegleria fowleri]|uniref:CHK kinase-like domain-containing protein n=1 Tax=Naegleria fowleri TaxID=5763 RepID=A0A6A5BM91_NAEFO|nr:uncharacterized protein FDP41_002672 [Naegleria fowleri]KAF0978157.1 hypothetical protein FDP41_002672 [Naegleria fowleri]CAG4712189.1 unnamed protein product [Naegleria fowleri]